MLSSIVGPMKVMFRDFWRMIWQKQCCKIVMLTNLMEACKVCKHWIELKYQFFVVFFGLGVHIFDMKESESDSYNLLRHK